MPSQTLNTFEHAIQDAEDLLRHFDALNSQPPPDNIEVLKRASLVMAMAALETYFEDRLVEAIERLCSASPHEVRLTRFLRMSLENDLKTFHTPSADRVRQVYSKYLDLDVSDGWVWNNVGAAEARKGLNELAKKRGDIAHRSLRPLPTQPQPPRHAVTRDDLRKHIHFVRQVARTTDAYLETRGQ